MEKKEQKMRYSDKEMGLIKGLFAENEDLLKAIRKVFLQMPLDPVDVGLLKMVEKPEVKTLLRKAFLPELDGNAPFHQVIDLWMTVEVKDKEPYMIAILSKAREGLINYLDQQLEILGGKGKETINFAKLTVLDKKTDEEITVDLINRNTLISHVEMQLSQFSILAGLKDESVEDTKNRLLKDSAK